MKKDGVSNYDSQRAVFSPMDNTRVVRQVYVNSNKIATTLMALLVSCLCISTMSQQVQIPPQLNGMHFRITALAESGFLDIHDEEPPETGVVVRTQADPSIGLDQDMYFTGYLIDMIDALARKTRANFTYTLLPPSGTGSLCAPQITNETDPRIYHPDYRTQYNCGASDVNDPRNSVHSSDMYLGMYYVTPARQLLNQFTIPFLPPYSGTLAMFGTATGIEDFPALVEAQQTGLISPDVTCGPAATALIQNVVQSYPGLQVRGVFGGEKEIYEAFMNQTCQVFVTDGPLAAHFVLKRSLQNQCIDEAGNPIGVIGDPMPFGLSHYAIGIQRDIPPYVENTLSYWMSVLMTCNPVDPEGPCPDGNFASFYAYDGRGGRGDECGYVLFPSGPALSAGAIAGIALSIAMLFLIVSTLWHRYRLGRQRRRYEKKSKAALNQAKRERDFNEYLSHEIRNPLASALAALTFVSSRANDPAIIPSEENRTLVASDVNVIDSSLGFVDELLRNLLDLHRTQARQSIKLNVVMTDIRQDVFEPVSTILFMRGASVEIQIVCPANLYIMTDRMRLKQICLNLASNAVKFVRQGFIRLRAEVVKVPASELNLGSKDPGSRKTSDIECTKDCSEEETVILSVEDSGPGIPAQKRKELFTKFQDSLDVLHQGTGIGLSVCKNLSTLMGCDLSLDDAFVSGVEGFPGTRFCLRMNQRPQKFEDISTAFSARFEAADQSKSFRKSGSLKMNSAALLPENLTVLFVDDDTMLRKMFKRVLKMAEPTWEVSEAANGEIALKVVAGQDFDLIFVDMYMASVEKQLLGTDTVRAMRANGVKSIICGLSANDVEENFLQAGANYFMSKPFPCQKDAFKKEMRRMLLTVPLPLEKDNDVPVF